MQYVDGPAQHPPRVVLRCPDLGQVRGGAVVGQAFPGVHQTKGQSPAKGFLAAQSAAARLSFEPSRPATTGLVMAVTSFVRSGCGESVENRPALSGLF